MPPETPLTKNQRRSLGVSLALFLLTIYLFTYRGGFHSVDEVSMFAVTENLVKFGQVNTNQIAWTQWTTSQAEAQGFFGPSGAVYSKKGLALSLAQAPLYGLALTLPGVGMLQLVSSLNAFISAATALLIFMFVERMGFTALTGVATGLIFGLATIAFVYAKYLFSEPLAGFLLLLASYMLFTYRQEGGLRHLVIAGLAAGLAVLTRANNLFLLPVFGGYLLWVLVKGRMGEWASQRVSESANGPGSESVNRRMVGLFAPLVAFGGMVGLTGAILLAYNGVRSGNPFQTGYDLTLFSPNILLGLYKLLFSPLRGFFIYSPILLLSLPGWWLLRRRFAAEAWLLAGLVGVTVLLFSAWSSGEGLSWGSRFLVPVAPLFALGLAPIVAKIVQSDLGVRLGLRIIFYVLLLLSFIIQILGVVINPWVFLAKIQTEFGGEFFLENTAALYDFGYSQIAGQLQGWSAQNSDLAWWQSGEVDWLAFGISLALVLLCGWLLWQHITNYQYPGGHTLSITTAWLQHYGAIFIVLSAMYFLLARYDQTDPQFGPLDDPYTRALNTVAAQARSGDQVITVAQHHYHVPMNRFKARLPMTGMAQQAWPLPDTALPLLAQTTTGPNVWLVTVGFTPASANNATERWLTEHAFMAHSTWFNDVRLIHFGAQPPTTSRSINTILADELELVEVKLSESLSTGQTLPVEFTWAILKQPQANYNLFLQLLTADGRLTAQHDSPPNSGYSPTTQWQVGSAIKSRHGLALPLALAGGDYRLIAGLYNPTTGQRLAVGANSDFVDLGTVTITR